jgi:hypothetical protein
MATKIMYTDDIHVNGEMFDSDGSPGQSGKALIATPTGSTWQDVPTGVPSLLTTAILNNVLVNTTSTMAAGNFLGAQALSSGQTWVSSAGGVTIPESGYYEISFSIATTSTAQQAFFFDLFTININGTAIGPGASAGISGTTGSVQPTSAILVITKQLVINDIVGISSSQNGDAAITSTTVAANSFFSIRKLGQPGTTTGVVSSAESSEATRNIIIGTSATPPALAGVFPNTIYFQRET